jgi:hypothetical protein
MLQGQTAAEAIAVLAKSFPRPTNAMALAALHSAWEATSADTGTAAGIPASIALGWFMPDGILPRMRLVACGWRNPGDNFRAPTDEVWWRTPFALPLWVPLATYARTVERLAHQTAWLFDDDMSKGDSDALSPALRATAADLRDIERVFSDKCLPYSVPRAPGVQPIPNAPCIAALGITRKTGLVDPERNPVLRPAPSPFGIPPWVFWAAVLWAITKLPE